MRSLQLSVGVVCMAVREVRYVPSNKLVKVPVLKQLGKKVIVYKYWRYEY